MWLRVRPVALGMAAYGQPQPVPEHHTLASLLPGPYDALREERLCPIQCRSSGSRTLGRAWIASWQSFSSLDARTGRSSAPSYRSYHHGNRMEPKSSEAWGPTKSSPTLPACLLSSAAASAGPGQVPRGPVGPSASTKALACVLYKAPCFANPLRRTLGPQRAWPLPTLKARTTENPI